MVYKFGVTTDDYKITKLKENTYDIVTYFLGIGIWVKMASRKSQYLEKIYPFPHTKPDGLA